MNQPNDTQPRSLAVNSVRTCATRWSSLLLTATLASVVALSGCGGGTVDGTVYVNTPPFDIHVAVAGQPLTGVVISPGVRQTVYLQAGQYIDLDANEPVTWSLYVGGTLVSGAGTTVYYGDVAITLTSWSSSTISIDTALSYPLAAPLSITLVATSTYDLAQVATIDVILTP